MNFFWFPVFAVMATMINTKLSDKKVGVGCGKSIEQLKENIAGYKSLQEFTRKYNNGR